MEIPITYRQLLLAVEEKRLGADTEHLTLLRNKIREMAGLDENAMQTIIDITCTKGDYEIPAPDGFVERKNELFKVAPEELIVQVRQICGETLNLFLTYKQRERERIKPADSLAAPLAAE